MHSFSELTELPFAMLLGGSFLAYQSRWWWICALLASLMPLTRPEGFGFIVIFFILLITQKRWWELLLLPIPVIGWSVAGWWLFGSVGNPITWVFDHWPYSGDSVYHAGPIWHFALALALKVLGPPIFLLMVAGFVFRINREFRTRDSTSTREVGTALRFLDHPVQLRHLILAIPLMIFIGHSVLYWLGKMASNGEPRYMLIVAPFWAVLGAVGFDYVIDRFRVHRWALPISMLIAIAPVVIWQISYPTIPLKMMPDWIATRSFASWYTSGDARARYPKLLVSHPGVFYHLDLPTLAPNVVDWNAKNIDDPPPGTILIWHDIYGTFNATSEKGVAFQRLESANWQEVTESILPVEQREIRVFVRD